VKKKRSKSSIFYDSTKNKRRKQEQTQYLNEFHERNAIKREHMINPKQQNTPFFHQNARNNHRNPASTAAGFFFTDEASQGSNYHYKKGKAPETYVYEFTNSKFIYFLGTLDPKAYLVFVTLIGLLITEDLNVTETKIIYAFISNIADTIQTLVEQEIILQNFRHSRATYEINTALQQDFETIYAQLAEIKKKLPD